jgi:hypothetical protein
MKEEMSGIWREMRVKFKSKNNGKNLLVYLVVDGRIIIKLNCALWD